MYIYIYTLYIWCPEDFSNQFYVCPEMSKGENHCYSGCNVAKDFHSRRYVFRCHFRKNTSKILHLLHSPIVIFLGKSPCFYIYTYVRICLSFREGQVGFALHILWSRPLSHLHESLMGKNLPLSIFLFIFLFYP